MAPPREYQSISEIPQDIVVSSAKKALSRRIIRPISHDARRLPSGPCSDLIAGNVDFLVRMAQKQLTRKESITSMQRVEKQDCFSIGQDCDLLIGRICDTNAPTALWLNRFNLLDYHALITTEEFLHQTVFPSYDLLFQAFYMASHLGYLAAFNCGPQSGASQPHWHCHVVDIPEARTGSLPLQVLLRNAEQIQNSEIWEAPVLRCLGIEHYYIPMQMPETGDDRCRDYAEAAAHALLGLLTRLPTRTVSCDAVASIETSPAMDISSIPDQEGGARVFTSSFNWLALPEGIVLVRRTNAGVPGTRVSVNGLSLVGQFFCRYEADVAVLEELGGFGILRATCGACESEVAI